MGDLELLCSLVATSVIRPPNGCNRFAFCVKGMFFRKKFTSLSDLINYKRDEARALQTSLSEHRGKYPVVGGVETLDLKVINITLEVTDIELPQGAAEWIPTANGENMEWKSSFPTESKIPDVLTGLDFSAYFGSHHLRINGNRVTIDYPLMEGNGILFYDFNLKQVVSLIRKVAQGICSQNA